MKKFVCEVCGGSNLMKQDGLFQCLDCGCKYQHEEVLKLCGNLPENKAGDVPEKKRRKVLLPLRLFASSDEVAEQVNQTYKQWLHTMSGNKENKD